MYADRFDIDSWKKLMPNDSSLALCMTEIYFFWNGNAQFKLEAEGSLLEDNIYVRADRVNCSIIE